LLAVSAKFVDAEEFRVLRQVLRSVSSADQIQTIQCRSLSKPDVAPRRIESDRARKRPAR
jgi:hypothetical protein